MLCTRPVVDEYLRANLGSGSEVQTVAMKVLRCQRLGPFYEVGARFVAQLDAAPD